MNEKIKELAKQAKITFTDYGSGEFLDEDDIDTDRLEKFAELIVKETLEVARAGIEYGPSMEEVVYKYFGVEE